MEFVNSAIGGSPIELDEGWLVCLTHSWGPVRSIRSEHATRPADPSKVSARAREPPRGVRTLRASKATYPRTSSTHGGASAQ